MESAAANTREMATAEREASDIKPTVVSVLVSSQVMSNWRLQ